MKANGAAATISEERIQHKGGKGVIDHAMPYFVEVAIQGTEVLLCHRYDVEATSDKAKAAKGSAKKKSDNIESYVYRNEAGEIVLPGLNFKASLCQAAKFTQDPRSPRKSAFDLFRAGIKVRGDASLGKTTWDYVDARKVNVQRNGITRQRPAFYAGWQAQFLIEVILPEYIGADLLNEVLVRAGRVIGVGDFRPDFGTFRIDAFRVRHE